MASEIDALKTNEFLRRRKLRLQQVREQSKDIAKKIRQRAKVEKLRLVTDIDAQKEKEYIDCQEKFVKRLELLYAKSLENVGASHKSACDSQQDDVEKKDLSKLRGKEAVAELRKKRQAQLDEQKKILDRKLQAREIANELSREKSSVVKNLAKNSYKKTEEPVNKHSVNVAEVNKEKDIQNKETDNNSSKPKADMGTQWECDELLNEWEPNVPALALSKEDNVKEPVIENEKLDKNKKLNLFALSDEMPSSLRGGLTNVPEDIVPMKPSLSLVSEYLQNRNLKLRQPEPSKKPAEDLQSIKQTILRTRSSKPDGSVYDSVCHVLDEQFIPVPSWQAEYTDFCSNFSNNKNSKLTHRFSTLPLNEILTSPKLYQSNLHANKFFKGSFQLKSKICNHRISAQTAKEKSSRSTEPEISLSRKKSVSVYNHNTRDILDMPCDKEKFVYRDNRTDEDAYSQALKETNSISNIESEELNKKQEDLRNKIAITRQNVDKEYRDTLAFLNSLPKDTGSKPIRKMYMDDEQQQLVKDRHQRKLQQEFKKIEKECLKHNCKHSKRKTTVLDKNRSKSKSPVITEELDGRDFEYSWMPVPESDGSLAIHTIPNTRKQGNTVKFSGTDSYHEYRSRHKHTPPTKENDDRPNKRVVETVILQNESENESSVSSDTSSVENLSLERDKSVSKADSNIQDAERIIIYKILNSRKDKKSKNKKSVATHKSVNHNNINSVDNIQDNNKVSQNVDKTVMVEPQGVSFDQMHEGVYKAVSKDGDNMTSMYFSEEPTVSQRNNISSGIQNTKDKNDQICSCGKNLSKTQQDKDIEKEGGDSGPRLTNLSNCKCVNVGNENNNNLTQTSAATSATSFKTAPNKANNANPDSGFIKLLDEGATETGKFYIGASGFIKDDNYEVVIQLRKKEAEKTINNEVKDVFLPGTPVKATTVDENKTNSADICVEKESVEGTIPSDREPVDKATITEKSCTEIASQKEEEKSHEQNEVQSKTRDMCEKAVHTSFQDTYPIPIDAPKTDPIQRPATSTYTQTSFNSSTQRPVFMHMTSSTSTAYMSPPEVILPKCLRNNYVINHEEIYESENTINQLESQYEEIETRSCRKYKHCKSKHCTCNNKRYQNRKKIDTPPNTARNNRSFSDSNEMKKRKCKCHKCKSRNETKICSKSHRNRSNSSLYTKSSKEFVEVNAKSPTRSKLKLLKGPKNKVSEPKINPVLKNYVHKLLALNKEGLKAVEIINQDCSIPTTPGSSVINLPSNRALIEEQSSLENKISLEQIKNILRKQILKDHFKEKGTGESTSLKNTESQTVKAPITTVRLPKKKSLHKVKSLNISRQFQKRRKCDAQRSGRFTKTITSTSSSTREEKKLSNGAKNVRSRSKSSPTPRPYANSEYKNSTSSEITDRIPMKNCKEVGKTRNIHVNTNSYLSKYSNSKHPGKCSNLPASNMLASMSSDSEIPSALLKRLNVQQIPSNISTQTKGLIDTEINFMKLAEDKLQNMEKIADLTDRCTKRLSNLAKVLEEVRRNKSLVYSQISTSESTSEPESKSDKNNIADLHRVNSHEFIQDKEIKQNPPDTSLTLPPDLDEKTLHKKDSLEFTPFLKDIPKPDIFKTPSNKISSFNGTTNHRSILHTDHMGTKTRGRPPPALTRHLKNGQETVMPHELSTVIEVDSPMSIKHKNQSSRHDTKVDIPDNTKRFVDETDKISSMTETIIDGCTENKEQQVNPHLVQSNVNLEKALRFASSSNESSDDSKVRMMDMKHFNNIMLKPFISLQDYAKQCNIGLEEGSNLEDAVKAETVNDCDLSSLHSDGSLPDVVAELLKRNIISEPFKFDTASNVNSTSISSESTLSLIALSKAKKGKKKSGVTLKNKENIEETSETLSISSNPDLENAFKKLGMGWASSTLKKTKERLALSSSSNTSSCSMTQFKIRSFSQDVPVFTSDSTSSLADVSNKREKRKSSSDHVNEHSKNAVQQTSLTNSMTVNEFLTNVLANKITFSNKSKNETDHSQPEFISLYETNMPEDMKLTNIRNAEDQSSVSSANNNRARTSTPVQIFKSTAYHSSSSSNTSNGLFSNADDLSSVKVTSTSIRNHSTSDKDELTIPNYSLKTKKGFSDRSKSD